MPRKQGIYRHIDVQFLKITLFQKYENKTISVESCVPLNYYKKYGEQGMRKIYDNETQVIIEIEEQEIQRKLFFMDELKFMLYSTMIKMEE